MSGAAILGRFDDVGGARRPAWMAIAPTTLAAVLFTIMVISLRPFRSADTEVKLAASGDTLNQLGYSLLACVAAICMLCLVDYRRLFALLSPWWMIMWAFVAIGTLQAVDPSSSMRSAAYAFAVMIIMCAILVLPRSGNAMTLAMVFMCLTVLAINYAGVLLVPGLAIHSAAPPQPEHVGLWRGSFSHKNSAGPVMACLTFAGIYVWRRGWTVMGLIIIAGATLFLFKTGSKTTFVLVPLAAMIVLLPPMVGWRGGTTIAFLVAIALAAVATLGMVFVPDIKDFARVNFPGMTYTGRTEIWRFVGDMLPSRLWTGYGFESFWETRSSANTMLAFDREWDVRGAGHAHNGYLDIVLTLGLPALGALVMICIVEPVWNYLRIPARKENVFLGDLFMMILAFAMLNAFLESFFFRRADSLWLFVMFSTLGLRMVARIPLKAA